MGGEGAKAKGVGNGEAGDRGRTHLKPTGGIKAKIPCPQHFTKYIPKFLQKQIFQQFQTNPQP
jgi:hypothetical protein